MPALEQFSPATRAWFRGVFAAPTTVQEQAWATIGRGRHALVVAPTGSGKTLAAFLWALDRLAHTPVPDDPLRRTRVLYVSPLKALAVDVERNLRAPLSGIADAAHRAGTAQPDVTVGIRSGDTAPDERRRLARRPPDILITTPESLYLMLTSQARETLRGVDTVIVDEVHAVAGSKRGSHLALSLERLDALLAVPAQRIGLSATVRPVADVARFLGGRHEVEVVAPAYPKQVELEVVVPVPDLAELSHSRGADSGDDADPRPTTIWPHVEERIVDLVEAHRSTLVFANSRRLAERLCARLNEIHHERTLGTTLPSPGSLVPAVVMASGSTRGCDPAAEIARAHHGSVSREQRAQIEDALKSGQLPAVVATSSLELGIDMGAIDLVIQVEPPPSVASGLQRVGRAAHHVAGVSRGVVFPKHRGDLVPTAVIVERMRTGDIESVAIPRNTLDVLAQQVVAMVAMDDWNVSELLAVVRCAMPFQALPDSAFDAVLDMLAGRYPSDAFASLRPRLVWDRDAGVVTARPGAQRLAVQNPGTIPDRGLFGVFIVGSEQAPGVRGGRRVGELDEEMVYESRVGDVFSLGATSWRIEEITHDQVRVSPAPGQPGRLPFWHGDAAGRPVELGRAIGAFVRELTALDPTAATARLRAAGLDDWAASNTLAYLAEQRRATGHVSDDKTIVVERFRDELGDWRVAIHSPFGARVHTPWAMALAQRMRDATGMDVQAMPSDDGIVLRLPDVDTPDGQAPAVAEHALLPADEVEALATRAVGGSALFASRFREAAGRALLLPRQRPDKRAALWQQRQRSAQLLAVAGEYPQFPIVLETMREVLQDVFDVPALRELMRDIADGTVRLVEVETQQPSPYARSLLFSYVGAFLYEGDTPLAERRAAALSLDATLLAELLGQAELRELLDPDALEQVERELQRLTPDRLARDAEDAADLLRLLGPLTTTAAAERGVEPGWLTQLRDQRRAVVVRIGGADVWAAVEDLGRLRDALGVPPPPGVAAAFLEPVADPVGDLVARYARTRGPFSVAGAGAALGLSASAVAAALDRLAAVGQVVTGELRPGGAGQEWCDAQVLRLIRRRSLAALRREAEPVPAVTLGRFLPDWHGVGGQWRGVDGVAAVVEQLRGLALPASVWESLVLPSRVVDYRPALLDELTASGEVLWCGAGSLPGQDGRLVLATVDDAPLVLPTPTAAASTDVHRALLDSLDGGVALFFRDLVERVRPGLDADGRPVPEAALAEALWDLLWSGHLTNDTLAPVRARLAGGTAGRRGVARATPRGRYARPGRPRPSHGLQPHLSGRWSRRGPVEADPTRRAHARAAALLERHGVVTRGSVVGEDVGGFGAVYRVLASFEEVGQARRGYFVEGLGAAQFAVPNAVDRLRSHAAARRVTGAVQVLAATDPANPYGAALPWPTSAGGHQPGRAAGAVVVLVDGGLTLYVERGGKSLLSWSDDVEPLRAAARALVQVSRDGGLGTLSVHRADGTELAGTLGGPLHDALVAAGFVPTPRGLRLRPTLR